MRNSYKIAYKSHSGNIFAYLNQIQRAVDHLGDGLPAIPRHLIATNVAQIERGHLAASARTASRVTDLADGIEEWARLNLPRTEAIRVSHILFPSRTGGQ